MKRLLTRACTGALGMLLLASGAVWAAPNEADMNTGKGIAAVTYAITDINEPWGLAKGAGSDIIVVSSGASTISKWTESGLSAIAGQAGVGYYDGYASQSAFHIPTFAAVDSKGIIYVSDTENHVIRKIEGNKVYTLAGNGTAGYVDGSREEAQFLAPGGLAVDAEDNVYVADTLNHVIRKITPKGEVTTYAGQVSELGGYHDGALTAAQFNEPMGLAFDENGRLYVADSGNHLIRIIDGDTVSTYAGKPTEIDSFTGYMTGGYVNGTTDHARFNRPRGIAYAEGVLFVADSLNHRIRAVQPNGHVISIAGHSTPGDAIGAAGEAQFNEPSALLYYNGKLLVSDVGSNSVKAIALYPSALQPIVTDEELVEAVDLLPASESVQGWLDGKQLPFTEEKQPYRSNERLYIPIRPLFEAWGAEVKWQIDTREAVIAKGEWSHTFGANAEESTVLKDGTMYADFTSLLSLSLFSMVYDEENNAVIVVSQ